MGRPSDKHISITINNLTINKMVRVNIINPKLLADQHLVAEYLEIIMLVNHTRKHPRITEMPDRYCLGKGHISFFKNKLQYLKKRHERLKKEMRKRGFKAEKTINLNGFKKEQLHDWRPQKESRSIIRKRLTQKIRQKPEFYRYYREKKPLVFFLDLLKKA